MKLSTAMQTFLDQAVENYHAELMGKPVPHAISKMSRTAEALAARGLFDRDTYHPTEDGFFASTIATHPVRYIVLTGDMVVRGFTFPSGMAFPVTFSFFERYHGRDREIIETLVRSGKKLVTVRFMKPVTSKEVIRYLPNEIEQEDAPENAV